MILDKDLSHLFVKMSVDSIYMLEVEVGNDIDHLLKVEETDESFSGWRFDFLLMVNFLKLLNFLLPFGFKFLLFSYDFFFINRLLRFNRLLNLNRFLFF